MDARKEMEGEPSEVEVREYLVALGLERILRTELLDEGRIPALVDALLRGEVPGPDADLAELMEMAGVARVMERTRGVQIPVPAVLKSVIANTMRRKEKAPAIVVRLSRRGLSLVKSTLAGLELLPQEAVAVRSAAAPVTPRLEMNQVVGNGLELEYQVMQESDSEMRLVIRFKSHPEGAYRVDLREDDRLVASQMLPKNTNVVSFSRIGEGGYQVDIQGPVRHSFGLYVAAEE